MNGQHIYVIAGTFEQAKHYINTKRTEYLNSGNPPLLMPNYLYVSGVNQLKGISEPHGVFIGTWRDRVDIYDIIRELAMMWRGEHQGLNRMLLDTPLPKKPTPKKRPTAEDVINQAAALLAKEIDKELLNIVMEESKQWTMLPLKPMKP